MDAEKATPAGSTTEADVRRTYRHHRYLQDLSDSQLHQFGRDGFRNLLTVDGNGMLAPLPRDHPGHRYWRVRLLHMLEECEIRYGPYPNGLGKAFVDDLKLPRPDSKRVQSAAKRLDCKDLKRGSHLIKYGQIPHIEALLRRGIIRIMPASAYAAFEGNDAIKDAELSFTYHLYNPTDDLLANYANFATADEVPSAFEGTAHLDLNLRRDYYVFCLSASYDPRLFDDFDADACLVIRSPIDFRERLMKRVASEIGAQGWAFSAVSYVDPYSIPNMELHRALYKHHRYSYQDEMRAVWQMPREHKDQLEPQFVEIGPLDDIASIVDLGSV